MDGVEGWEYSQGSSPTVTRAEHKTRAESKNLVSTQGQVRWRSSMLRTNRSTTKVNPIESKGTLPQVSKLCDKRKKCEKTDS